MNHRIKNLFALVNGLVTLSARGAASIPQLTADPSGRIASLARAHQLTLPDLADAAAPTSATTTLQSLLTAILAPYERPSAPRISIAGADAPVGAGA